MFFLVQSNAAGPLRANGCTWERDDQHLLYELGKEEEVEHRKVVVFLHPNSFGIASSTIVSAPAGGDLDHPVETGGVPPTSCRELRTCEIPLLGGKIPPCRSAAHSTLSHSAKYGCTLLVAVVKAIPCTSSAKGTRWWWCVQGVVQGRMEPWCVCYV